MSMINTRLPVVLEPASQGLVEATAGPPFLHELSPTEARAVLDQLQAAPIDKLPVDDRWTTVPADVGDVRVRIVRPPDAAGTLPVILYMHGGGWVLGNAGTHDRLVRELAVGTGAAVVFVEYDRSPEARYPVAIEQGYATAQWIVRRAPPTNETATGRGRRRLGRGNVTAALTLMAQQRGDVRFVHQSMYCPVTDAAIDAGSCARFAEGYFLTAKWMAWTWTPTSPTSSGAGTVRVPAARRRRQLTASRRLPDGQRGRRTARRGRGLRPRLRAAGTRSPPSATTASRTTS